LDVLSVSAGMTLPVQSIATTSYATTIGQAYQPQGMIHATSFEEAYQTKTMPLVSTSSVKRWEDRSCISDTGSEAYTLLSQGTVDEDGLVTIDGYIAVALGQKYGRVGDKFIITIGGKRVKCIMADAKANCDTNGGWTGKDGHVIEMIVDSGSIPTQCQVSGDMNDCSSVQGRIEKIEKLKG
jgi:hypothetical protein